MEMEEEEKRRKERRVLHTTELEPSIVCMHDGCHHNRNTFSVLSPKIATICGLKIGVNCCSHSLKYHTAICTIDTQCTKLYLLFCQTKFFTDKNFLKLPMSDFHT